jgi:hypothetical protein
MPGRANCAQGGWDAWRSAGSRLADKGDVCRQRWCAMGGLAIRPGPSAHRSRCRGREAGRQPAFVWRWAGQSAHNSASRLRRRPLDLPRCGRRALPPFRFERDEKGRSHVGGDFQSSPLRFQSEYEDFRQHRTAPAFRFAEWRITRDLEPSVAMVFQILPNGRNAAIYFQRRQWTRRRCAHDDHASIVSALTLAEPNDLGGCRWSFSAGHSCT